MSPRSRTRDERIAETLNGHAKSRGRGAATILAAGPRRHGTRRCLKATDLFCPYASATGDLC